VNQISWEPLNGFAPNSQARHVWSFAQTSLNVKGQAHQGLPSPPAAMEWNVLAANNVMQQQMGPFRRCQGVDFGGLCAIYVW